MDIAAIATCPERDKYVAILMDEMHIKESLVYDKHSGIKHKLLIITVMNT